MTPRQLNWRLSFFTRAIAFRFLLTPIGTILINYHLDEGVLTYQDVYIFGIRIARINIR